MASSFQGKPESHLRLVSDEEALVIPENARSTDESPTVISKTPPLVEPSPSNRDKVSDLSRKPATPESIVASLRGRRLAHYELIEPIGVGGMAAVIRARDTQLDRFVALKILPPEMAQEEENVQRFHQEAKAAAKLDHENIARVFYCGEEQGLFFIAFEFVEGMNLRTLLEQRGRIPVAEAIRYILQIATGLEHAATRGVVHRDVKPSNIIISPNGRAKLVDMGLARNLERHGERDLTQSGVTLGTFDYISPEQALEPREADARSDIYSLGCTLYHMLTGIPPAPDGTPAKKLHHHQHLAPVDPRQFNPEIPDAIVMILGKMMAKNPKDRYQRPIHLVHHLMQIAQQVGAADDMPEGVLFVDAPLPGKRRSRPVMIIGMALAALVALIVLLSFAPEQNPPTPPSPAVITTKGSQPNPNPLTTVVNPPIESSALPPSVVNNLADLKAVFGAHAALEIEAKVPDTINLDSAGITFRGSSEQQIVLQSSDEVDIRTVNFQYKKSGDPFALALEGGKKIVFRRIKFVIESDYTPDRAVAALAVRGAQSVTFEQCMFIQKVGKISSAPNRVPLASVLIDAPENSRPTVNFIDCYFDGTSQSGGQVAVAINGPATVKMTNCAFRPHAAFFSFRDQCKDTTLDVQHCTGFVEMGPAFRFSPNADALLRVEYSVFSRPGGGLSDRDVSPGLIYLAGEKPIRYEGRQNLYHNLNSMVQIKDKPLINSDQFPIYVKNNHGDDASSTSLDFASSPLQHATPLSPIENLLAFQLKPEYHGKFGLLSSWSGKMPKPPDPLVSNPPLMPRKKIVDADDPTLGVFRSVAEALIGAKDGDVIHIKHGASREVPVSPVSLPRGIAVTLMPHAGYQPILVLDKTVEKKDSTLFEVQKSKLHILQMGILLDPEAGYDARSIVQGGEGAILVFEKCTFTLKATNTAQLSVVTFLDLDRTMKMEGPAQAAHVAFHDCFVRGKGNLVALHGCRLLNVEMTNSLIVLDGSLLDIEAANKAMPMDQGRWNMAKSSVYTKDSVFALRTKNGKGLTKTHAEIKGSLLASLAPDQAVPLVLLDKDDKLGNFLDWTGEQNFYANFDHLRDDMRDWKDQFRETKSEYSKLTFPQLTEKMLGTLWDASPDWFIPLETEQKSIIGFGRPADSEIRPAPPNPDEP
jgi:serine/threonine protein kinase